MGTLALRTPLELLAWRPSKLENPPKVQCMQCAAHFCSLAVYQCPKAELLARTRVFQPSGTMIQVLLHPDIQVCCLHGSAPEE